MPHPSDSLKLLIEKNSAEINHLKGRIRETFALRDMSPQKRKDWEHACKAFHSRYDELTFPGGWDGALDRLIAGAPEPMKATICFLEVRPYFFRSGYMFDALLRRAKRAPLTLEQKARLQIVINDVAAWKARKRQESGANARA